MFEILRLNKTCLLFFLEKLINLFVSFFGPLGATPQARAKKRKKSWLVSQKNKKSFVQTHIFEQPPFTIKTSACCLWTTPFSTKAIWFALWILCQHNFRLEISNFFFFENVFSYKWPTYQLISSCFFQQLSASIFGNKK